MSHINNSGEFQSDKLPQLAPDKIVFSFKDKLARRALEFYATMTDDSDLAKDIFFRVKVLDQEYIDKFMDDLGAKKDER